LLPLSKTKLTCVLTDTNWESAARKAKRQQACRTPKLSVLLLGCLPAKPDFEILFALGCTKRNETQAKYKNPVPPRGYCNRRGEAYSITFLML